MILSISSSIETFKTVRLRRGLNVLLADIAGKSTEGHTRNSAGKSSLGEIVHFLLGGDADKKTSLFKVPGIAEHSFTAVLRINGKIVAVTRRCDDVRKSTSTRNARGGSASSCVGRKEMGNRSSPSTTGKNIWAGLGSVCHAIPWERRLPPSMRLRFES